MEKTKINTIKILLWDIDGVLVDTEKLHFEAWNAALEQFGKKLSIDEYAPLIGRGGKENAETICALKNIACDFEKLREERRFFYEKFRKNGISVIIENINLLKDFVAMFPHFRHAAVSSAGRKDIEENLRACQLDSFFELAVSYEDIPQLNRKPAPYIYLYTLQSLNVKAEECIAFEDSENGLRAARSANILCVALPNKLTKNQNFSLANCLISFGARRTPKEILTKLNLLS